MNDLEFESVLRRVSRSFYLSLRILPPELRPSISLAYALARASDTIADSATLPSAQRIELLQSLETRPLPDFDVTDPGEKCLLTSLPSLLDRWKNSVDHDLIGSVWRTIREGQIFDLERFVTTPELTPEELEHYTDLVAGCVGEFWTDISLRHLPNDFVREPGNLRKWGRSFGRSLQRVNILRDRAADARLGRIYVPEPRFAEEARTARLGLLDGLAYAAAIGSRRMRFAVLLPARLGQRTLDLVCANPQADRVKLPRWKVWQTVLSVLPDLLRRPK